MRRSPSRSRTGALAALALVKLLAVSGGVALADTTLVITPTVTATQQGQDADFAFSPKIEGQGDTLTFNFGDGASLTISYSAICQVAGGCGDISHLYPQPGTYTVTASGTISGTHVSGSTQIAISALSITADTTTAGPGQPITFTFTPKLWTSTDAVTFWFGDGTSQQVTGSGGCQILGGCGTVAHAYGQGGAFTVTAGGATGGVTVWGSAQVTVQSTCGAPAPTAAFSVGATAIRPWQAVQFTDHSTGSPTAWSWDFGDGSAALGTADGTSTQQSPVYTFVRAGTFTVTLTASNCKGSSQSQTTVHVAGDCAANGGTGLGCWKALGPFGGYVSALAQAPSDPSVVYAGVRDTGMFKSGDGGRTWARACAGVPSRFVSGFAVDALDPDLAYAAGTPLLRTHDGGATWAAMNLGLTPFCSTVLAADPKTTGSAWLGTCAGLFKTTDGGANWLSVTIGGATYGIPAIAVDPTRPDTIYVVANGVRKTTDGGAHWALLGGLALTGSAPFTVAIDPTAPDTVYVSSNGGGIFVTTDGGTTWTDLKVQLVGIGSVAIQLLALDPDTPGTVLAQADTGLYRTTDGGKSWGPVSTRTDISVLLDDPSTAGRFLAGLAGGGVLESGDDGSSWRSASAGLSGVAVTAVAAARTAAATVYAGTQNQWVLASGDGGATWAAPTGWPPGGTGPAVSALAVDPVSAGVVYLGTVNAVQKTTDSGATWANVSVPANAVSGTVVGLGLSPANPATVYAATNLNGVYKSVNGGVGWSAVNSGINDTAPKPATVAVAVDPSTADTAYLATVRLGAFKTTNGGASWAPINAGLPAPPLPGPAAFAVDPLDPAVVYVGMENTAGAPAGVYKSLDGGQHWSAAGSELADLSVVCLAVDPSNRWTVYAGTQGAGVFRSTDGGASWQWMSDGLDATTVTSIAFDGADSNVLYAGTPSGVYSTTVSQAPMRVRRHLRRSGP